MKAMRTHISARMFRVTLLVMLPLTTWLAWGEFKLNWATVDGGGGASTGGVFTVHGTIGQPDTGAMSGGNFSLTGGFWSLLSVVPSEGAPLLALYRTPTNSLAVTWPSPSAGWTLQQNTSGLDAIHWSNVTIGIQDDGQRRIFLISPPTGNRFYRLVKP